MVQRYGVGLFKYLHICCIENDALKKTEIRYNTDNIEML